MHKIMAHVRIDAVHYLCFGVGGANGWVFVGLWMAIEKEMLRRKTSLQSQIRGASGASVGSLLALAVVLNYTAIEFCEFLKRCTMKYKSKIRRINVFELASKKGILSTEVIGDVVQEMLAQKLGENHRMVNLETLYDLTHKEYVITTHNTSYERGEVIDCRSFPLLPVHKAVQMSCAIPGIFHAIEHNGCLYTDAGISNGLPFEVFPLENSLVFNLFGHHGYAHSEDMGVPDFFCRVVHAFDVLTRNKIEAVPAHLRHHILTLDVPCLINSALQGFILTDEDRDRLIHIGLTAGLTLFHYQTAVFSQAIVWYMASTANTTPKKEHVALSGDPPLADESNVPCEDTSQPFADGASLMVLEP